MKISLCLALVVCLMGARSASAANARFAPLEEKLLDRASFLQWVAGEEGPLHDPVAKPGPRAIVWTRTTRPDWPGVNYGEGRAAGLRHLRIGFTEPVEVGTVLVRGGGSLSVLKASAKFPGKLDDEADWTPAERLLDGKPTQQEVGREGFALWILPPGTKTRGLRFSHTPDPGDSQMGGWLGGISVLAERLGNLGPQAFAQTTERDDVSAKLVDEANNRTWDTWQNGEHGAAQPVSPAHPAFITLSWPQPVTLNGVCLLWVGFSEVAVEAFEGAAGENLRDAPDSEWRQVGAASEMDSLYPIQLAPYFIAFDKPIASRAIRLRVTKGAKSGHPHLADKVKGGRRIWLGECLALAPLADRPVATLVLPKPHEEPPPIAVKFKLDRPGLVTLVIEDAQNRRVRNLVSETPFPAGENTAWWDGSDDLLRDPEAAHHGVYHIPTRLVAPGAYKVRGLVHDPLQLHYEFSIYSAGKPAWETADRTGCWLTTHTPPSSIAVVPGSKTADGQPLVMMGAFVAEGGHGLQWLHEDGTKLGGQGWVGGNWTGAPTLAVDLGPDAIADQIAYVGSVWEGELRLTAKTRALTDQPILKDKLGTEYDPNAKPELRQKAPPVLAGFDGGDKIFVLGGIAAYSGQLVCSLVRQDQLLVVDVKEKKIAARIHLDNPRGLAFDSQGRLLVLSGQKLVRLATVSGTPETVLADELEDPRQIAIDAGGNVFIADRGKSHQVKVFSAAGKLLRAIGKHGAPAIGPYDPLRMNNPNGLAIDSQGRVWVAETDNSPRRVSVWSATGELIRAFYGPTEYGGGGTLDPQDRTRFYYKGLEFKLDWTTGQDQLVRVFARPNPLLGGPCGNYSPDTPLYPPARPADRYFTSCYTHNPTNGDDVAFIWHDRPHAAELVAAVGNAHAWAVLRSAPFRARWPQETQPENEHPNDHGQATFVWTDLNHDGQPQPDEVQFVKKTCRGVTVMNDLSVVVAQFGSLNARLAATFDDRGLPHYDLHKFDDLGPAGGPTVSSGGDQSLVEPSGWAITTNASQPFSPYGPGGKFHGEPRWSYPSAWPGLHASHEAAVPDRAGELVGTTRLLGGWVQSKVGPLFCVNGNMGNMYLLTADGLFVGTLFNDIRLRPNWGAPVAIRNMDVTDVSLHDENFWPSITQTKDGNVYLVDGGRTSLMRVDGLDTLRALPESTLSVTAAELERARDWFAQAEAARQRRRGNSRLRVAFRQTPPHVDGRVNDWPLDTDWAFIDRRGTKANFNSDSRPYEVQGAVAVTATDLYAAWQTTEKDLLKNSGETPNALFKHGGCLDLMLGTNPDLPADRVAGAGDERLLITEVKGATRALLYRAKVAGVAEPVAFSSPWRTIHIDAVEDVSSAVELATDKGGNYEIRIALAALHWKPEVGKTYRADIGILRGADGHTTQRVYWANKATAITADVPSEAELTPRLWGEWKIVAAARP